MTNELHPLNTAFEWRVHSTPLNFLSDEQACAFDADGSLVLENVLDRQTVDEIREEIDRLEADYAAAIATKTQQSAISRADEISFAAHLVPRSPILRGFVSSEPFTSLVSDLVGRHVRLYWDQAVYKKPGKSQEFPWHQDNGYAYVEPQQYLTCWIPLVDATIENGCPWVVPALHTRGTLKHEWTSTGWRCLQDPEAARPCPAAVGSIVVFSSLTPHRTGPNLTDEERKAYIVQFAPDGAALADQSETGKVTYNLCNDSQLQFTILDG